MKKFSKSKNSPVTERFQRSVCGAVPRRNAGCVKRFFGLRKFYDRMNLRKKLLSLSAILILFTITAICFVNYHITINKVSEDMLALSTSLTEQRLVNFENVTTETDRNIFNIYNNSPLQNYLKSINSSNRPSQVVFSLQIEQALKNILYSNMMIDAAIVSDLNGQVYTAEKRSFSDYDDQLKSLIENQNELLSIKGKSLWQTEGENIFVERLLYNSSYVEPVGYFSVKINQDYFRKMYSIDSSGSTTHYALVDSGGEFFFPYDFQQKDILKHVLFSFPVGLEQDFTYGGGQYKVNIIGDPEGRMVIDIIPLDSLTKSWNTIIVINFFIGGIVFLIVFIVMIFFSTGFSNNINRLIKRMDNISQGNFFSDIHISGQDELSTLGNRLNELGREMDRLLRESVREQQARQEMEYKMLEAQYSAIQSQIDPHFMYNSLESISSLAMIKGAPEVSEIVCDFANLLRSNVMRMSKYIPLHEEIEYLKNYVKLYKYIYPKKFSATFYLDPEISDVTVPSFVLLPLVENVVVHQVERSIRKIQLEIVCCLDKDRIVLEVRDNGDGMEEQVLQKLIREINSLEETRPEDRKHARVGLKSINRMIKLRYGEAYGLEIESRSEIGTAVRIHIPAQS